MTLHELMTERAELLAVLPAYTLRHDPRVDRLQDINTAIELGQYSLPVEPMPDYFYPHSEQSIQGL